MHVARLTLHDFRSWSDLDLELGPGATAFVGRNGQGKTNLVEAIDYLSRLGSHRVAGDAPLVRAGTDQAVVRAAVIRDERRAVLEIEINPGRSNRGRINKSPLPRARELLGLVRTVVFSPEDLALVKGDPSERRHFADDLLVQLQPRYAGVRTDYDRVLKQRNSLIKSARRPTRFGSSSAADGPSGPLGTLGVWDANLARLGAEIVGARMRLIADLSPLVGKAYEAVARGATRDDATMVYRCSFPAAAGADQHELEQGLLSELERLRGDELDRGISLAGPHRDDLVLSLGDLPAKGYASHGESWSFALALRLASYDLLRSTGDDPILVLDDVFAELDTGRRQQLAELVGDAEQVLVTAAVADDVPVALRGTRYTVADGTVTRDE